MPAFHDDLHGQVRVVLGQVVLAQQDDGQQQAVNVVRGGLVVEQEQFLAAVRAGEVAAGQHGQQDRGAADRGAQGRLDEVAPADGLAVEEDLQGSAAVGIGVVAQGFGERPTKSITTSSWRA
ncbi:hypothetical protein V1227_34015 [Lentzea sp. DG1S-22]|uniref:hypothetical protein n=1 Tax=Lentzea sp. DG1S-22 TaxID=3108822 RepID=UPI002E76CC91|nr:hypothetical protein [Lentzea sp. DG1S-22]WVH79987.1 hypothetical protein V1227_34015 [Lentzea sp. DG1S-22]